MTLDEMQTILRDVAFMDYVIHVFEPTNHVFYLQVRYVEICVETGKNEVQTGRKWLLSRHMTRSELVQTAFKACLTSMEHRTREQFTYRGKRIFGPHFDVDALAEICGRTDARPSMGATAGPANIDGTGREVVS